VAERDTAWHSLVQGSKELRVCYNVLPLALAVTLLPGMSCLRVPRAFTLRCQSLRAEAARRHRRASLPSTGLKHKSLSNGITDVFVQH
jgi:hypothetical protein